MLDSKMLLQQVMGGSISLIAVTITLIAIFPVFLSLVKARNDNFIQSLELFEVIKTQICRMYNCLYLFSSSSLISFMGLFYLSDLCLFVSSGAFTIGLAILVISCIRISSLNLTLITDE